ncbi:MAG TPA: VWA domain-containing protein [Pyrinomonadaceae bacterium]|nr:VWA domain-containing protein [Pyrinomonadaceae bacterium]
MSNKRFVRVLALALAASSASAGAGARAQQQQQSQPQPAAQQQQKKPAQRPDETIDEDEVERVETDLTNVLFTATDRNKRFISNIKLEDIVVLEDGVPQQVFTFQRNVDLPLSLAILIDTSNSQERTLPEEKRAAQQFVDTVIRPNKDEVAVLSFTGETTLEQGLTGSASRARRAIERVEFQPPSGYIGGGLVVTTPGGVGGGTPPISGDNQNRAGSTAIWDSIWVTSREVLSETSDKTRRAIILLTDGDDTSSRMKLNEAIDSALKADAIVYAIGIGDSFSFSGVDEGSLRKITERTGGRAYFPRSEADLRSAFAQIQDELREQYLVAYSPSNKAKDGTFRKVQIDFKDPEVRKNMKLTYRQGYFARSAVNAKPRR